MAIDELFSLLEQWQRSGRMPTGRVRGSEIPGNERGPASVLKTIGSGLTLAPLVRGVLGLFGNNKKDDLPALTPYEFPAPIRTELGLSSNGDSFVVDRGAGDRIRRVSDSVPGNAASVQASTATPAAVTVNINAMDSQSFLDRREDIARAVREAMLHSHSVNDVVNEL